MYPISAIYHGFALNLTLISNADQLDFGVFNTRQWSAAGAFVAKRGGPCGMVVGVWPLSRLSVAKRGGPCGMVVRVVDPRHPLFPW